MEGDKSNHDHGKPMFTPRNLPEGNKKTWKHFLVSYPLLVCARVCMCLDTHVGTHVDGWG